MATLPESIFSFSDSNELNVREEVISTIRDNPGITTRGIKCILPHIPPQTIEKHIRRMSGWIIRRDSSGLGYKNRWKVI